MSEKKELNLLIGARIKLARERVRMTQERLAERIDVTPQFVSDVERGVVGVSVLTLKRICLALGISSDAILFDEEQEAVLAVPAERFGRLTAAQLASLIEIVNIYIDAVTPGDKGK